jgi:hypothetical protein
VPASLRTGDGERLRKQKLSELLHTTWFVGLLVILPSLALVIGASQGSTPLAIGAPIAVVFVLLLLGNGWAAGEAEEAVVESFATRHGLTLLGDIDPPPLTPLLVAGDERTLEWAMTGLVVPMEVLLGHYTYTDITVRHDKNGTHRDREDHPFTIATTDVEAILQILPTLHLRPRGGLFSFGSGWLRTGGLRSVETESVRFNERFQTWVRDEQDDLVVRRVLDPSVIDTLANHPLEFGVELSAGQLLVHIPGHCSDSGELDGLLDALAFVRTTVLDACRAPSSG